MFPGAVYCRQLLGTLTNFFDCMTPFLKYVRRLVLVFCDSILIKCRAWVLRIGPGKSAKA